MTMEKIPVAACANGVLMQAFYDRSKNDIVIFDNGGKALGYIKARPAFHGIWKCVDASFQENVFTCSICHEVHYCRYAFCPSCGADMREVLA